MPIPASRPLQESKVIADDRYDAATRVFHWMVAALIAGMYVTDWVRSALERGSPARAWWLSAHESLGLLILALSGVRLLWRLTHSAPPVNGTPFLRSMAKMGHALLYAATIALPITGIARVMAGGDSVVFFGFQIESWTARSSTILKIARLMHGDIVMNILLALIAGHVLAALWHNFVLKDNTLRRMALVRQGPRAGGR
jgi:cytochrome b561